MAKKKTVKKTATKVTSKKTVDATIAAQAHIQKVMDDSRAAIIKKSAKEYAKRRK